MQIGNDVNRVFCNLIISDSNRNQPQEENICHHYARIPADGGGASNMVLYTTKRSEQGSVYRRKKSKYIQKIEPTFCIDTKTSEPVFGIDKNPD